MTASSASIRLLTTSPCRAECQLADWKVNKKGCKIQQVLNEVNNKYNLKPLRPPVGRCTGCSVKFDDENYPCEDVCEDCGYQVCESCCVHSSRGTYPHSFIRPPQKL